MVREDGWRETHTLMTEAVHTDIKFHPFPFNMNINKYKITQFSDRTTVQSFSNTEPCNTTTRIIDTVSGRVFTSFIWSGADVYLSVFLFHFDSLCGNYWPPTPLLHLHNSCWSRTVALRGRHVTMSESIYQLLHPGRGWRNPDLTQTRNTWHW